MKLHWSATGFSGARKVGDALGTGRVEFVPGSGSDSNNWNWSACCSHAAKPNVTAHQHGSAASQAAASEAVESFIAAWMKRFAPSEAA